jgi:GT2 family glycosyltransferase
LGFAAANNLALTHCTDCDWLALINPDAFIAPDWLDRMLSATRRHTLAASFALLLASIAD